jgi:hypothetical protein
MVYRKAKGQNLSLIEEAKNNFIEVRNLIGKQFNEKIVL